MEGWAALGDVDGDYRVLSKAILFLHSIRFDLGPSDPPKVIEESDQIRVAYEILIRR